MTSRLETRLDIETRLDRSLANQIRAPRLDGRFDASVWARIEAQEQHATNPVRQRPNSARWLLVINIIGVAVAALLVLIFGLQSLSEASVTLPALQVSAAAGRKILELAAPTITIASLVFGLLCTPLGRRLRAELT